MCLKFYNYWPFLSIANISDHNDSTTIMAVINMIIPVNLNLT
jgi:hypothetical protein